MMPNSMAGDDNFNYANFPLKPQDLFSSLFASVLSCFFFSLDSLFNLSKLQGLTFHFSCGAKYSFSAVLYNLQDH